MIEDEIRALADRIRRTAPSEFDRRVPRMPKALTKILLSDEEKAICLNALWSYASKQESLKTGAKSDEDYDHSYGD
jgi:hypothetical protein